MISYKYKFLILTDHRAHTVSNSLYTLTRAIYQDARCLSIDIASRGTPQNDDFFRDCLNYPLWARQVNSDFSYDSSGLFFDATHQRRVDIQHYDIILMRLPRPVGDDFLSELHLLTRQKSVINNPLSIVETSNKLYLLNYPQLCPPIAHCKSIPDILQFASQYETVLKPLKEYGGRGLVRIRGPRLWYNEVEMETNSFLKKNRDYIEKEGYLAMAFLKNVDQGDKRIIIVNGTVIGAILRMPVEGHWLCNVSQGGSPQEVPIDNNELHIIDTINADLRQKGIVIYGIDTLIDDQGHRVLSEINTLSIGGFINVGGAQNNKVLKLVVDQLFDYILRHDGNEHTYDTKI